MTSRPPATLYARLFSLGAVSLLGIFVIACGLASSPQPAEQTVVVTVLVTAASPPSVTNPPSTSTAGVLSPTETFPPPPPDFPQVSRGGPNGDNQDSFRTLLDFASSYFLRMYVFYSQDPNEKFKASKDGRDIKSVEFTVTSPDGAKQYYDHTEKTPGYCFFGGGEPDCNRWTVEGGRYVWKPGGPAVRSGRYGLTITVTANNGDAGTWLWNAQEGNPIAINVP